jgi:hypothetical protein
MATRSAPSDHEVTPWTYLPVHVRALSPKVDTPDHVGLEQVAGLAFANELGNRLTASR